MVRPPRPPVGEWLGKISQLPTRNDDVHFWALKAMAALISKEPDPKVINEIHWNFNFQLSVSSQYDRARFNIVHLLLDGLPYMFEEFDRMKCAEQISTQTEEESARCKREEVSTQTEEESDESLQEIESFMEEMFSGRVDSGRHDTSIELENSFNGLPSQRADDDRHQIDAEDHSIGGMSSSTIPYGDVRGGMEVLENNQMDEEEAKRVKIEIVGGRGQQLANRALNRGIGIGKEMKPSVDKDSSKTDDSEGRRRRISRTVSMPLRYTESAGVMLLETRKRTQSVTGEATSKSLVTPKCVHDNCEVHPTTPTVYMSHLQSNHASSLVSHGIYLLCACGHKITSRSNTAQDHNKRCQGLSFTIHKLVKNEESEGKRRRSSKDSKSVRDAESEDDFAKVKEPPMKQSRSDNRKQRAWSAFDMDSSMQGSKDEPETAQCVHCDRHPASLSGYITHLYSHNRSTLKEEGIYLLCACGKKVTSNTKSLTEHNWLCHGLSFTMHKLNDE